MECQLLNHLHCFCTDQLGGQCKSAIVQIGWRSQYQLGVVLVLPLIIFNYIKRNHVERMLARMNDFDEKMVKMNWTSPKSRSDRNIGMGLVVSSILLLLLYQFPALRAFLIDDGALACARFLVFLYVIEFHLLISFQFIFGTLSIYRRFSALNMNVRWGFCGFQIAFLLFMLQPNFSPDTKENGNSVFVAGELWKQKIFGGLAYAGSEAGWHEVTFCVGRKMCFSLTLNQKRKKFR